MSWLCFGVKVLLEIGECSSYEMIDVTVVCVELQKSIPRGKLLCYEVVYDCLLVCYGWRATF